MLCTEDGNSVHFTILERIQLTNNILNIAYDDWKYQLLHIYKAMLSQMKLKSLARPYTALGRAWAADDSLRTAGGETSVYLQTCHCSARTRCDLL